MIFVFAFSNMNSKSKIQSVKIFSKFYIKGIVEIIKFISGNTKELRVTIQKIQACASEIANRVQPL